MDFFEYSKKLFIVFDCISEEIDIFGFEQDDGFSETSGVLTKSKFWTWSNLQVNSIKSISNFMAVRNLF